MGKTYDLIVVGGGPAGLMAARTAADMQLKVALVEKRKDIARWTRADCMMFYGLEGGFLGEDIRVDLGKVVFQRNAFEVRYTGALYPLYNWRVFSPGGHRIDFCSSRPIAAVFDKGVLLRGLLEEAENSRVEIFNGALGVRAENTPTGVRLLISRGGPAEWLEAKKLIAADGINSRITQSVGLNDGRPLMGRFHVVEYVFEGVRNPYPNTWIQVYGKSISPFAPLHFLQTVHGEHLQKLGAIRPAPGNPEDDLRAVMQHKRYGAWFEQAAIAYKMATSVKAFMPLENPVCGNVLAVGDAAAFAEVENQGALMCGYHAARAISSELQGCGGIQEYINWWRQAFEFHKPDVQQIAQGYAINPYYEDDEIDYLFSLVEGQTFEGTVNQYKLPQILWGAIFRYRQRIRKERPELGAKIEQIQAMSVQEAFTV